MWYYSSAFATISLFRFEMSKEFTRGFCFLRTGTAFSCSLLRKFFQQLLLHHSKYKRPHTLSQSLVCYSSPPPLCIVYQSKQYKSEFGAQHNKVCRSISSSTSWPAQFPSSVCKQDSTRAHQTTKNPTPHLQHSSNHNNIIIIILSCINSCRCVVIVVRNKYPYMFV